MSDTGKIWVCKFIFEFEFSGITIDYLVSHEIRKNGLQTYSCFMVIEINSNNMMTEDNNYKDDSTNSKKSYPELLKSEHWKNRRLLKGDMCLDSELELY